MTVTKVTGEERLLAHMQMLCDEPSSSEPAGTRLNARVEPSLAALLVRALRLHDVVPRGARRL